MMKILIAEDNELNMKLMFDILTSKNYEVETAQDGEIALEKLEKNKYDLLLLDLQMPKKSGYDVLEELREKQIKIKTVIVSALAMEKELVRARELGCLEYITKPIRVMDFLQTVDNVIKM